jgi:hypothetical protein
VKGILRLAYKLLVNDKGKFAALLVGITFAVFLMVMMTSMFSGILYRSSATVINTGAKILVMDPAANTVVSSIPMADYILDAVRSIKDIAPSDELRNRKEIKSEKVTFLFSAKDSEHNNAVVLKEVIET